MNSYNDLRQRRMAFQKAYAGGNLDEAYSFMTPEYREKHSLADFVRERPFAGLPEVSDENVSVALLGGYTAEVYEYPYPSEFLELYSGCVYYWHRVGGVWYFTDKMDQFFD